MTRAFYRKDGNELVLCRDGLMGQDILWRGSEVAIAFDSESLTLHKHGDPEIVGEWVRKSKEKLIAGGAREMAEALSVISGPFEAEDLNSCMECSGFLEHLLKKIQRESSGVIETKGGTETPRTNSGSRFGFSPRGESR